MSLLDKLMKAGSIKDSEIMAESPYFNARDMVPTELPILNVAFSGKLDGGLVPGLTILAGESKSFKTLLGLYCLKAYFKKYPDAVALIYDSEFSLTPDYLQSVNIDPNRVIHVPIEHIEQLKFDIVKRIEQIDRKDHVFILVDSLGALASKKETEDAHDEKSVADMSRARSIRSLLRIITPSLTKKDIPCIVINHVYQSMDLFSKAVVGGGSAVTYAANQIFIITKAQEKETDGSLAGYKFTINIEKSRFVREKSKLPFVVTYNGGISKYSGLLDIALEGQFVAKPKNGWYCKVNRETGELVEKNYRLKDTNTKEFWQEVLDDISFKQYIEDKFMLSAKSLTSSFEERSDEEDTQD